jgi:aerobic carbon-monoxide dehydrogenase medium subunit
MQAVASAGLVPTSASTLPPFALLRPAHAADAAAALRDHERAVALAGGTDLVAAFNEGLAPTLLVDLSRIGALRRIELDGDRLSIGAGVVHADGCSDPTIARHAPGFATAWRRIANPRIRATGTIGGNLMARRVRYEGSVLLSALGASLAFTGGATAAPAGLWRTDGVPGRALLESIVVPLEGLRWFGYERSLRPLLTIATALREGARGWTLRCAVATEYLAPVVLERELPIKRLADLADLARGEAEALLAALPEDFRDPVLDAGYGRAAGSALLARQLQGAARG